MSEREIPVTNGFDFPVGKPDAKGYYVAAGLAEQEYYERFRGLPCMPWPTVWW